MSTSLPSGNAAAPSEVIEYVAAGGVVIDDGRILLLDRPSRNEIRLPKGHVEPDETDAETALRETIEETGYAQLAIVADLGQQVVEFEYRGRRYRRTEHYYLMRLAGREQAPRPPVDAAGFRPFWAPAEQAPALLTYEAEQETVRRALAVYRAGVSSE